LAVHPWSALERGDFFFGASNDMELSIWMGLGFAPLAVGFFLAGIFESIVLMNFGPLWLVVVPLFTGLAAILLTVLCLRIGNRHLRATRSPKRRVSAVSRVHEVN